MNRHMPDSPLNEAERGLQHPFMKSNLFNGLLVAGVVLTTYLPIRALPDRASLPERTVMLKFEAVGLPQAAGPLRVAGAWEMGADDRRFGGLSGLALDGSGFLAVSDLGAVVRFDPPWSARPRVILSDLADGPGSSGRKTSRDAESLARDPRGRGWWIGYEQRHSLWLYDDEVHEARAAIALNRPDWWRNRGVEGLVPHGDGLLALAENGREAIRVSASGAWWVAVEGDGDIADAALAPDGSIWVLLRSKGFGGIRQAIAPLLPGRSGYRVGPGWPVPKRALDNYEGLAIAPRPNGGWRFWLVTDDGHRVRARTLLVALDLDPKSKRPAQGRAL